MRGVLLAAMCTLLAGCPSLLVKPDPIAAQCNPIGWEQCQSRARWDADASSASAWDALAETLEESRAETRQCEIRRKALEQCLRRLEAQGVVNP